MDPQTLLSNLRALLVKSQGLPDPQASTAPAAAVKLAAEKLTEIAVAMGDGTQAAPEGVGKQLASLAALVSKASTAVRAPKTTLAKAELDAFTATKVSLGGMRESIWAMEDAMCDMDADAFAAAAAKLKMIGDNVATMAPQAFGGGTAAPATGDTTVTARAPEATEMNQEQFTTWLKTETAKAVQSGNVEHLTKLAEVARIAKESFFDAGATSLPVNIESFAVYPGTGGAKSEDLTVNADQEQTEGNLQADNATGAQSFVSPPPLVQSAGATTLDLQEQGSGDSAFAMNAAQVMKALEDLIAAAPAKPVDDFIWPLDLSAAHKEEAAREETNKSLADAPEGFGRDPWAPRPSFPAVR